MDISDVSGPDWNDNRDNELPEEEKPQSPTSPLPPLPAVPQVPAKPPVLTNLEPVIPNQSPEQMFSDALAAQINNSAAGHHIDPNVLKDNLFDASGHLNSAELKEALAHYDAHDVYDALISASTVGGKDLSAPGVLPSGVNPSNIIHTSSMTNEEAIKLVVSYLAFNNESGHYADATKGKLPPLFLLNETTPGTAGFAAAGMAFVNRAYFNNSKEGMEAGMHELSHSFTSKTLDLFENKYHLPDEGSTGFLTHLWRNDPITADSDKLWLAAVRALSDPSRNTNNFMQDLVFRPSDFDFTNTTADTVQLAVGIEILQRAKYGGDPLAMQKIEKLFTTIPPDKLPKPT